jgi:hypothetical protein
MVGRRGTRVRNPAFGDQPSRAKSIQLPGNVIGLRSGDHLISFAIPAFTVTYGGACS